MEDNNKCGLWKQKTKDGKEYLSGRLPDGRRIMIFANQYKAEGSRQPDYVLKFKEEEVQNAPQKSQKPIIDDLPF